VIVREGSEPPRDASEKEMEGWRGGDNGEEAKGQCSVAYVRTAEVAQLDIALVVTSLKITLPQATKRVAPVAAVRRRSHVE